MTNIIQWNLVYLLPLSLPIRIILCLWNRHLMNSLHSKYPHPTIQGTQSLQIGRSYFIFSLLNLQTSSSRIPVYMAVIAWTIIKCDVLLIPYARFTSESSQDFPRQIHIETLKLNMCGISCGTQNHAPSSISCTCPISPAWKFIWELSCQSTYYLQWGCK